MNSINNNIFDISVANKFVNDANKLTNEANELVNFINEAKKIKIKIVKIIDEINEELNSIAIDDEITVKDIINDKRTLTEFIKKHNRGKFNDDSGNKYLFPIKTKEGKKVIDTSKILNNIEDINKFNGEGINISFTSYGDFLLDKGNFKNGVLDNGREVEYHYDRNSIYAIIEYKKEEKDGKTIVYGKKILFSHVGYIISVKEFECIDDEKSDCRCIFSKRIDCDQDGNIGHIVEDKDKEMNTIEIYYLSNGNIGHIITERRGYGDDENSIYGKEFNYSYNGNISSIRECKNGRRYGKEVNYFNGNINSIEEYKNEKLIKEIYCYNNDSEETTLNGNKKKEYKIEYISEYYDDDDDICYNLAKEIHYHKNGNKDYIEYYIQNVKIKDNNNENSIKTKSVAYYAIIYNDDDENSIKSITYCYDNDYYNNKPHKLHKTTLYDSNTAENTSNKSNIKDKIIAETVKLINEIGKINKIDKNLREKLVENIFLKAMDEANKIVNSNPNFNYNTGGELLKDICINKIINTNILEQLKQSKLKPFAKEAHNCYVALTNKQKNATVKEMSIKQMGCGDYKKNFNALFKNIISFVLPYNDSDEKLITTINNGLNRIKTIDNIKDISNMDVFKKKNNKNNKNKLTKKEKELSKTINKIETKANEYINCIIDHLYDNKNVNLNKDNNILTSLTKATPQKSNSIRDYAIFRAVNNYLKNEKKLSKVSAVLNELYKDREINKDYNLIKHKENWYTYNILQNNNMLQNKLNVLNNKLEILEDRFIRNNRQELDIVAYQENITEDKNNKNLLKLIKTNKNNNGEQSLYSKLMEIDKSIEKEIGKEKENNNNKKKKEI